VIYEHEEPWWNDINGGTPDLFARALWQSCQQSASSKAGGTGKLSDEFCLVNYVFHTLEGPLTCCKILRHGVDGFTPSLKEDVLQNFITFGQV
jgi:hypothetical protein